MNVVITLVRIPLALIAAVLVIAVHAIQFIFETAAVAISLPFAVVFMDRNSLKQSWISKYPHVIRSGYGNYESPVELDWDQQGCFVAILFPLLLLVFLLFPRKGLIGGLSNLLVWVVSDTTESY